MTPTRQEHILELKFGELANHDNHHAKACRELIDIYNTITDEQFDMLARFIRMRVPGGIAPPAR